MVDVSLNEVEVGRGLPQVAHHHDQRPADLNGQRVIKKRDGDHNSGDTKSLNILFIFCIRGTLHLTKLA